MPNIFQILKTRTANNNWASIEGISEKKQISQTLRSWLTETALLTDRLKDNVDDYRFEVLQEYFNDDEEDGDNGVFVREVAMLSTNKPYIYGQTKTSRKTIAEHPWINQLGKNTLGEALKHINEVLRSEFTYCCFSISSNELAHLESKKITDMVVWARRSCFTLGDSELLTTELFLPGIECLNN